MRKPLNRETIKSVLIYVMPSRRLLFALVTIGLIAACVSNNSLPPVAPPSTTASPPLSVRFAQGDTIFLPDGLHPMDMAVTAEKYWVLADDEPIVPDTPGPEEASLLAIEEETGVVLSELVLVDFPSHVIADDEAVWVAHWGTGDVTKVDPVTGDETATIHLELPFDFGNGPEKRLFIPNDLALGHGSLWVGTARGALARVQVDTHEVEIIELEPGAPGQLAVDDTGIWIAENVGGLSHIDAETEAVIRVGLDRLDHSASQILVVGNILYALGDRLARTEDGDFRVSEGSYIASNEYSLSRLDLGRMAVTDTAEVQFGVQHLGWVEGRPGIIGQDATFLELEPAPGLLGEVFQINQRNGWPYVQLKRETWLVDNSSSMIRRLRATTSAGFALPFTINDEMEPRPVNPEAAASDDWIELDRGPLEPRWPAVAIWTGEEIVIWGGERGGGGEALEGGAAYDPATDTWRMMSENPMGAISEPGWVWTGDQLLVWDGRGEAAAWDPQANTWRIIEDWPLAGWFYRRSVWTGEEILDVFRNLAVDPQTGASRPIADAPRTHQRASMVWADGYMVSVTGEGSYHLESDTWREMPPSGLTPLAVDGIGIGSRVIAADYEMNAAVFDPVANTWSPLPDLPLRFFECAPKVYGFGHRAVFAHCSGVGLLDMDERSWTPLALPLSGDWVSPVVIPADDHIYVWGDGLFRTAEGALEAPSRLAVGISFLDRPEGWEVTSAEAYDSAQLTLVSPDGGFCVVAERHLPAIEHLRRMMRHRPIVTQVTPHVGGEPVDALQIEAGAIDDRHHLTWASSTSDVVDVACDSREDLSRIAPRVWAPWQ